MTGKIFDSSTNIYQDQAKVLFDYYKEAAEKIVTQEEELEDKIAKANSTIQECAEERKRKKVLMIVFLSLGATSFITALIYYLMNMHNYFNRSYLNIVFPLFLASAVFLILFIVNIVKMHNNTLLIKRQEDAISAFNSAKQDIRREYNVNKLGIVYIPVSQSVPFEDKEFLVDYTGGEEATTFSLSFLHKPQDLKNCLSSLEERLSRVPVVEGNEDAEALDTSAYSKSVQSVTMHNYIGKIDREVRNISYLLNDNSKISVTLPIVTPGSSTHSFIKTYGTQETEEYPILNIFDAKQYSKALVAFEKLRAAKEALDKADRKESNEGEDSTKYLKNLMNKLAESVTLLSKVKINASTKLQNYTNLILSCVLKAGYNQYSPTLEAEEIEKVREASFDFQESVDQYKPFNLKPSSRVKYELMSGAWTAEDGSKTNIPFGLSQVQEEVLAPVINNLMNETRIERLKIYNNIKDQKLHYLNEWNKDIEAAFRDNRKTGQELITQITKAYAEYNTAFQTYKSFKSTKDMLKKSGDIAKSEVLEVDNTAEEVAGFELQAAECNKTADNFQEYMTRLQEDINEKSEQFEHIEYFEASLRDGIAHDTAKAMDIKTLQTLDSRQKALIQVSPYNAAYSHLPPPPSTEEKLEEDFGLNLTQEAASLIDKVEQEENKVQNTKVAEDSKEGTK